MKYTIQTIVCGAYRENAYLLCPEEGSEAILIDPGDDLSALKRALSDSGRKLGAILLTHGHFDHMLCAQPLKEMSGAKLYIRAEDASMLGDARLNVYNAACSGQPCPQGLETEALGTRIEVCGLAFDVLHTPGHTPGGACFYDAENALLFSGDTLFCAGFGRIDLPGGNHRQMRGSLAALFALPADTRVLPGHGCETRIGDERARYDL